MHKTLTNSPNRSPETANTCRRFLVHSASTKLAPPCVHNDSNGLTRLTQQHDRQLQRCTRTSVLPPRMRSRNTNTNTKGTQTHLVLPCTQHRPLLASQQGEGKSGRDPTHPPPAQNNLFAVNNTKYVTVHTAWTSIMITYNARNTQIYRAVVCQPYSKKEYL